MLAGEVVLSLGARNAEISAKPDWSGTRLELGTSHLPPTPLAQICAPLTLAGRRASVGALMQY